MTMSSFAAIFAALLLSLTLYIMRRRVRQGRRKPTF
jgi:hypothetical protein